MVHVQTPLTIGHAATRAARRHGARVVMTNHTLPEITLTNLGGKRGLPHCLRSTIWRITCSLDHKADVVVVPSASAIEELYGTKAFRGRSLVAISNGVDTDLFSPDPEQTPATPTVLFVGRVDHDKDIGTLITAISMIPRATGVRLRIVGDGKYMTEAQALVDQLDIADRVTFTGWLGRAALLDELRSATVFCLPSVYETQSIATLEAMAAGLPVVVSDGGAVKDLCAEGVNGFVCPGGCPASFAHALATICSDAHLAHTMGHHSRTFALAHSVATPVAKHLALYRSLTSGAAEPGPNVEFSASAREVLGQAS